MPQPDKEGFEWRGDVQVNVSLALLVMSRPR